MVYSMTPHKDFTSALTQVQTFKSTEGLVNIAQQFSPDGSFLSCGKNPVTSRLSRQSEFLHLHLLFLGLFKRAVILSNVRLLPGENWCWKPQVFCPPCLISWRRTDIPKHILLILRRHTCRAFVIHIKRFIFGKKQMDTRQTEEKKKGKKPSTQTCLGIIAKH